MRKRWFACLFAAAILSGCTQETPSSDSTPPEETIPLHFQAAAVGQQVQAVSEIVPKTILKRLNLPSGTILVYAKENDPSLHGAFESANAHYDLGVVGDLPATIDDETLSIQPMELFGKSLIRIKGVFGANAPVQNYYAIDNGGLSPFLRIDTGHAAETDLDGDGTAEIVSTHGTPAQTYLYKWSEGAFTVADVNEALGAVSVYLNDKHQFEAFYSQDRPIERYEYRSGGLRQARGSSDADASVSVGSPQVPAETPANVEPVAALPEHGVYLYPGAQDGVILQIGERRQQMDWNYTTPRQIMPVLSVADYDQNGAEELAAILNVGSGTGVSVYELHVVEWEGAAEVGDAPFEDHVFRTEDYLAQLGKVIGFRKAEKNGEWIGRIAVGGETHDVSLKPFDREFGADKIQNRAGFGSIVGFEADNGKLAISAAIGLVIGGVAEPQYFGTVEADVRYASGSFRLDRFRFVADP
ncbi:hypothetical protein [Cohnella caldifontis]|uniref:hypothetical protein n=1 Tax=Cohnella caldifontis TaxID=3027471 RepID=UPI0023EDE93D|nr:hypothetical protein [Cohnella sp. YIM B05605]